MNMTPPSLLLCSTLRRSWEQLKSETESAGRLHINLSGKIIEDLHHQLKEFREQQRDIRRKVNSNHRSKYMLISAPMASVSTKYHNGLKFLGLEIFSDLVGCSELGHKKEHFSCEFKLILKRCKACWKLHQSFKICFPSKI